MLNYFLANTFALLLRQTYLIIIKIIIIIIGHVQRMEEGRLPKMLRNEAHQEEENKVDLKLPGRKGLED